MENEYKNDPKISAHYVLKIKSLRLFIKLNELDQINKIG